MNKGELRVPFRWYETKESQDRFRAACEGECLYKLNAPSDRILPFIFRTRKTTGIGGVAVAWRIYTLNDVLVEDISARVTDIFVGASAGYEYYIMSSTAPIPNLDLAEGFYYCMVTTANGGSFFSEVFYVAHPSLKFTRLIWSNPENIAGIIYNQNDFKNELWLPIDTINFEPEIAQEGNEDGQKNFYPSFTRYTENWSFQEFVPQFMAQALALLSMHKHVYLYEYGLNIPHELENIRIQSAVENTGCVSLITATFQYAGETIVATSCGDNDVVVPNPAFASGDVSNVHVDVYPNAPAGHFIVKWTYSNNPMNGVELSDLPTNNGEAFLVPSPAGQYDGVGLVGTFTVTVRGYRYVGTSKTYGPPHSVTFTV